MHFEGVTEVGDCIAVADDAIKGKPGVAFTADKVLGADPAKEQTVGMFYPGATYKDGAGKEQRTANTGHLGHLDSLEGARAMRGMNVFSPSDGGK